MLIHLIIESDGSEELKRDAFLKFLKKGELKVRFSNELHPDISVNSTEIEILSLFPHHGVLSIKLKN